MNPSSAFGQGYALVIGIGADLPVTIRDATSLRDLFVDPQRCAYLSDHVRLLTEKQATRQGILDGLNWLIAQTRDNPEATAIIFFSGHGGFMPHYYLVAYGYYPRTLVTTTVSGQEFTEKLRAIHAKKLLVLLDCCHAGGMAEAKAPGFVKAPMPPELDAVLTAGSGRVVIASSRKDEVSFTGSPYSVFTQALLEGLSGYGAAEQDGYAYVADVAMYVGREVPNRTKSKQHPILKLSAADNFAIAYYAGGEKSPQPLEGVQRLSASQSQRLAQHVGALMTTLATYTSRIEALEKDIARELDAERLAVLKMRLQDVRSEQQRLQSEIEAIEQR